MKIRIVQMLLWSVVVTLLGSTQLASAQQSGSSSSGQQAEPAGQTTPANSNEVLEPPSKTDFWDGEDPNLVNLVTHPFANKKYVQRMVRPIKNRLNELDDITASNATAIKDVDTRAQHGLQLASEKTDLADQHATDAANRAQLAQTAANEASTHVSHVEHMVGDLDQYKPKTETEIRFRPGQTLLSKAAKDALDQMAAPLKDQRSYVIEIRGFAPGNGQAAIAESQKIADSVVRYLVLTHNIPVYRIYSVGMGNAPEGGSSGEHSGARVEVSLLTNELASAVQR